MENFKFGMNLLIAFGTVILVFSLIIMFVFKTSLSFAVVFTLAWIALSAITGIGIGKYLKKNREEFYLK